VDTYTVAQIAKVLDLSQKRVRQLLTEGKLTEVSRNPVKVSQAEVIALKQTREKSGLGKSYAPSAAQPLAQEIQALIDTINQNTQRALTALEQASEMKETALREQIANLQAERDQLKADLEAKSKRRLFRR
jgi:hypothetical protein